MSKLFLDSKLAEGYRNWVVSNYQHLESIDNFSRIAIYLTIGKIDKSQVLTELCITLTKLVNFINDQIMLSVSQGAKTMSPSFPDAVYGERSIKNSRLFLTIIEHMKVLLELVANKIWGATGKSTLIFFVLILRCCIQLYLLLWRNVKLHDIGPLPPFERRDAASNPHRGELSDDEILRDHAMALTLNSGRRIHGIRTEMRLDSRNVPSEDAREKSITKLALLGKALTVARPVSHFSLMTYLGQISWIPWLTALITDLLALTTLSQQILTPLEKAQIDKWKAGLFMYLLRPPFFNKLKTVIYPCLRKFKLYSPSVVYLVTQVLSLITEWQKIYFHVWD